MQPPLPEQADALRNAHVWRRDQHDFYIEDRWVSDEFFKVEKFRKRKIHDPFCGSGRILEAASNHGHAVSGSDIIDRLSGVDHHIFGEYSFRILDATGEAAAEMFRWDRHIVTNPPYQLADHLLRIMRDGLGSKCALFMRLTAIAGKSRFLRDLPLARVLICKPRPNCLPGELVLSGVKPGGGQVDFAWFVFEPKHVGGPVIQYLVKPQRLPRCSEKTSQETPNTSAS